ncbi:MAG: methyltransferase [Hyphomicrobium sp.]|nr:MAG: methyltransferase [Hyphomicrobium sp.]
MASFYRAVSLAGTMFLATAAPLAAQAEQAAPSASETVADKRLADILAAQPEATKARYGARRPAETLRFCEVREGDAVIETLPGGGWYSRILHPYLGKNGRLTGANYPLGMFKRFGWDDARVQSVVERDKGWPKLVATDPVSEGGAIDSYTITEMPDGMAGSADKVLFIRSLHNLNRFDGEAGYLKTALAEAFRSLKPGGIACVVQHQAAEDAPDAWADGTNGYLKQSGVVAAFEAAGFKFAEASDLNVNPKDRPTASESVWRLPPNLRGVEENSVQWRAYKDIGESTRMTLKFVKPPA